MPNNRDDLDEGDNNNEKHKENGQDYNNNDSCNNIKIVLGKQAPFKDFGGTADRGPSLQ